jgi:hypothetical protein
MSCRFLLRALEWELWKRLNAELNWTCRRFVRVLAMAEASALFAVLPGVAAPPRCSSRTRCSMQWQRRVSIGSSSVQRTFGVGTGRVVTLRAGLWRGVCRAADQNSDGVATSPTPVEVTKFVDSFFLFGLKWLCRIVDPSLCELNPNFHPFAPENIL